MARRLPVWMTPRTAGQRTLAASLTPPPGIACYVTTVTEARITVHRVAKVPEAQDVAMIARGSTSKAQPGTLTIMRDDGLDVELSTFEMFERTLSKLAGTRNPARPNRGFVTEMEWYRTPGRGIIMVAIYETLDYRYAIVATNVTNPSPETQDNGRREADQVPF